MPVKGKSMIQDEKAYDRIELLIRSIGDNAARLNVLALVMSVEAERKGRNGSNLAKIRDDVQRTAYRSVGTTRELLHAVTAKRAVNW